MAEPYQQRGLANPEIVDLITYDEATGEAVLVMMEERSWGLGRPQQEQLNDKLNSYFVYVLDGHFAEQYPRYLGYPVRLQLDCVEEPPEVEGNMLREAARVAREHGLGFLVRIVAPEAFPRAPWEQEDGTPVDPAASESAVDGASGAAEFRYSPEVLTALARFGLAPRRTTPPELLRQQVNALYVFELRELKAKRRELESFFGPQPLEPYGDAVKALKEKYKLLSLPLEGWCSG